MNNSVHIVKEALLAELNERMAAECPCSLREHATQAVPGSGSATADIIFIGEAPGKNEDLKGVPFIGAAGNFLDEMLNSVNLLRKDIYITNLVKFRPPDNRDPLPSEIADCASWLQEQITLIDPVLVVTLGRHAMNHFLPDLKISEAHGKAFRKTYPYIGTRVLIPLYHPAAALYNGSMRETLKRDFFRLPKILDKTRSEMK